MHWLTTAFARIRRDPRWWRKVILGGALWLTGVGALFAEGFVIESIDNTQRGYPTPLPRWDAWSTKAIYGLFGLVIDFFYFMLPAGAILLASVCLLSVMTLAGSGAPFWTTAVLPALLGAWPVLAWLTGISSIAKQRYVASGNPGDGLSGALWKHLRSATNRRLFARARLETALPYVPALVLLAAAAWLTSRSLLGAIGLAVPGLILWFGARLVALQVYAQATADAQRLEWESWQARVQG